MLKTRKTCWERVHCIFKWRLRLGQVLGICDTTAVMSVWRTSVADVFQAQQVNKFPTRHRERTILAINRGYPRKLGRPPHKDRG